MVKIDFPKHHANWGLSNMLERRASNPYGRVECMHYPILVNQGIWGKLGQLKVLDSRALFCLSSSD